MSNNLVQADEKAPESTKIKMVHLGYELKEASKKDENDGERTVDVPVYLSRDKDMMLCIFKCPYYGDRDDIILAGTSFFLV